MAFQGFIEIHTGIARKYHLSIGMEYHTTHHTDYNIETTGGKGVYLLYIVNTVSREGGVFNILSSKIINILKLFSM